MELKHILQDMGHALVTQYGFKPANLSGSQRLDQSTAPIVQFMVWLESTPEAKQVLAQMGYGQVKKNQVPPIKIV